MRIRISKMLVHRISSGVFWMSIGGALGVVTHPEWRPVVGGVFMAGIVLGLLGYLPWIIDRILAFFPIERDQGEMFEDR